MRQSQTSAMFRLVTVLSCVFTAACSGGGGISPAPATSPAPTTTTPAPTTPATPTFCGGCVGPASMGSNSNTGIAAGPIAAPAPASFGTAPAQTASSGTPTFDGANGSYPANATFPLIATTLKAASPGMSAVATPDATVTVVSTSANAATYQIAIPSLNLNTTFTSHENLVKNIEQATYGYSYVVAGFWSQGSGNSGPLQSITATTFGYETPGSAMPATGTASFAGTTQALVYIPVGGNILTTYLEGKANLSVNFSSGQVTGALTQMQQWDGLSSISPGYLPWNDVSLNANIAPGTNRFSGATAATSAPATTFSLAASATGKIDGAFYGPAAQNVGAVWSLSDGSKAAIGTLTGK